MHMERGGHVLSWVDGIIPSACAAPTPTIAPATMGLSLFGGPHECEVDARMSGSGMSAVGH